jgi:hypothetical protein
MDGREELYKGIVLSENWPPRDVDPLSRESLPVPYLDSPPDVIPIDIGRQLFVDDYLIESTTLTRRYHVARIHGASPVLRPETELELNHGHCPAAAPFNDGVWYDPADGLFKMWYHAGWFDQTALAISSDGIHWERPSLDVVPGTNAVIRPREGYRRDGGLVWLDSEASPGERFKMFLFFRRPGGSGGEVYSSADGIHWSDPISTSPCGDNSSFFHNPFRKRFVFSIRECWPHRGRSYYEHPEFIQAAQWQQGQPAAWARTDSQDQPDPLVGDEPQLYDLNAVAYESILLGAFAVFYGPENSICAKRGEPKIIDLQLGYSRDGFHWSRPSRSAFISCSRQRGTWNYGYVHAAGGVCLVVGEELWFYHGAFSGHSPKLKPGESGPFPQDNAMYAGASTGLATLRRDGFASMDADDRGGTLTTRPVVFRGQYLFVNVESLNGEIRAEILDERGNALDPFRAEDCEAVSGNSTCCRIQWANAADLAVLKERPVRFRFHLRRGKLYSFWVSRDRSGESRGFLAAGGPGMQSSEGLNG